jgi:hypothetical protein
MRAASAAAAAAATDVAKKHGSGGSSSHSPRSSSNNSSSGGSSESSGLRHFGGSIDGALLRLWLLQQISRDGGNVRNDSSNSRGGLSEAAAPGQRRKRP